MARKPRCSGRGRDRQRTWHSGGVPRNMSMGKSRWLEQFWSHVQIGEPNECWPWIGRRTKGGYGRISPRNTSSIASRLMLELELAEEIPKNIKVCHSCDNPPCCNPSHLSKGTTRKNMQDSSVKRRNAKRLSWQDVKEIRQKYLDHMARPRIRDGSGGIGAQLAKEYGIYERTVWKVIREESHPEINRIMAENNIQVFPARDHRITDRPVSILKIRTPLTAFIRTGCVCGNPECTVKYGFCHCGCEGLAAPARQSDRSRNWKRGLPIKFVPGHQAIGKQYRIGKTKQDYGFI